MSGKRRVNIPEQELRDTYQKTGSVKKVSELFNVSVPVICDRLRELGIELKNQKWTESETNILLQSYVKYRDSGKLNELAADMGRSRTCLLEKAIGLKLADPNYKKLWQAKWKYMPEDEARTIFEEFKGSKYLMGQFCKKKDYRCELFSKTMRKYFPDEWEAIIESKAPRQTLYRYGRYFEYKTRDDLRKKGYFVLRSPRSGSPTDLVAIKIGIVLFVQCKRGGDLRIEEWNELFNLANSVGAIPLLAEYPLAREIYYWKLKGLKEKHKKKPLDTLKERFNPQIIELHAFKGFGEARTEVEISELKEEE